MKILGRGWQAGDPMPLVGWVLFGTISGLIAVTVGAFVSLAFYYFRGFLAFLLYHVYPDWVPYHADIAWTLGFTIGVVSSLLKQNRMQLASKRSGANPKKNDQQHTPSVSVLSLNDVVKRTLVGGGVGTGVGASGSPCGWKCFSFRLRCLPSVPLPGKQQSVRNGDESDAQCMSGKKTRWSCPAAIPCLSTCSWCRFP